MQQALLADARRPKKERRTAKALHAQIAAAGYEGGYSRLTDYIRQWRAGRPSARRLAHQMIAKLPANVELADLIQVGMIGLSDALSRFDAAQGVQFETFAHMRDLSAGHVAHECYTSMVFRS